MTARTAEASSVPEPHGKPGGPGAFHIKGAQFPPYIQHVAGELIKKGKTKSEAYQLAIGIVRNWAQGRSGRGGKVSADVQAAAVKAIAAYDALRARAKTKSDLSVELASRDGHHIPGTPYEWKHGYHPLSPELAAKFRHKWRGAVASGHQAEIKKHSDAMKDIRAKHEKLMAEANKHPFGSPERMKIAKQLGELEGSHASHQGLMRAHQDAAQREASQPAMAKKFGDEAKKPAVQVTTGKKLTAKQEQALDTLTKDGSSKVNLTTKSSLVKAGLLEWSNPDAPWSNNYAVRRPGSSVEKKPGSPLTAAEKREARAKQKASEDHWSKSAKASRAAVENKTAVSDKRVTELHGQVKKRAAEIRKADSDELAKSDLVSNEFSKDEAELIRQGMAVLSDKGTKTIESYIKRYDPKGKNAKTYTRKDYLRYVAAVRSHAAVTNELRAGQKNLSQEMIDMADSGGKFQAAKKGTQSKADLTAAQKKKLPDSDSFNGTGRFPINNRGDVARAVEAIGRVKSGDRDAVVAYIKRKASQLGCSDLVANLK